jgi:hypothetical protein
VELNRQWYAAAEIHERRWSEPFRVHQRVWRAHLHRRLAGGPTLGVGFTYFQQGVQDPEAPALPLVGELRPHLQADLQQSVASRLSLNHRARLEYRATPRTSGGLVTEGYTGAGRFRYRLGGDIPLGEGARRPVVRISDEWHVMFGDRPLSFDQNRLQAGVEWPLTRSLSVETAYLWWHQRRRDGAIINRDYLRVTFNHRIRRPS